jgi:hypothetical protein
MQPSRSEPETAVALLREAHPAVRSSAIRSHLIVWLLGAEIQAADEYARAGFRSVADLSRGRVVVVLCCEDCGVVSRSTSTRIR